MRDTIKNYVLGKLPGRVRKSTKGWLSFNAVCCTHNGETPDRRGRGGVITDGDAISYHCFNCGFKARYVPGENLGYKFKKLLSWFGASDTEIQRLSLEALRVKEIFGPATHEHCAESNFNFEPKALPKFAKSFSELAIEYADKEMPKDLMDVLMYASNRVHPSMVQNLYWSPAPTTELKVKKMNRRMIIPFTWENKIVGYTARLVDKGAPKYYTQMPEDFVYNIDRQDPDATFAVVVEGPLDAMPLNGIGILTNDVSPIQAQIINSLKRRIIMVPDRNKAGYRMIDDALEYGWSVSFPDWEDEIQDVSDAVNKYGRLYTLKSILAGTVSTPLKIELMRKKANFGE